MKKPVWKIRIFLWSVLGLALVFFVSAKIVPTGYISYKTNFIKDDFFIRKLTPIERVMNKNEIIDNPVYFSLFTPRGFDKAKLKVTYSESAETPLFEAGVMIGEKSWNYRMVPFQNTILDDISWSRIEEGGISLWQRNPSYNNLADFYANIPARDKISLYNIDLKQSLIIPEYKAQSEINELDLALRGSYQFYTYITEEALDFNFIFQDLNQNRDQDGFDITLYQQGKVLNTWRVDDDGVVNDNGELGAEKSFGIAVNGLSEGVYKIEIKANDDILTKGIKTKQTKVSFVNNLHLAKTGKSQLSLYSDSQALSVKTINPDSLQTLRIGNEDLVINETYKQFSKKFNQTTPLEIKIPLDGIILASDGVFALSPEALINPEFKKVNQNLDLEKVDYVLARYQSPHNQGEFKTATAELDLTGAYYEKGQYNLMLSLPGLGEIGSTSVKIKELEIELFGKTFWQKIKEVLENYL